jgi:TIR domain
MMQKGVGECRCTLIVLSPNFPGSGFVEAEWTSAFAKDLTGENGILVPIRVAVCEPSGWFRARIYLCRSRRTSETSAMCFSAAPASRRWPHLRFSRSCSGLLSAPDGRGDPPKDVLACPGLLLAEMRAIRNSALLFKKLPRPARKCAGLFQTTGLGV